MLEMMGIIATLIIVVSMCAKTSTFKGAAFMRITNLFGSLIFIIYGLLLPAYSTVILNGALVFINVYQLILLIRETKGNLKENKLNSN